MWPIVRSLIFRAVARMYKHAKEMLKTAVRLFVEEAEKMGTLEDILDESRYKKDPVGRWIPPKLVATELVSAY